MVLVGGGGSVRVRRTEEGERMRVRESERGTGRVGGLEGCVALGRGIQRRRRQPGREEVAGARGRARRARARVLLAREEDDRGGSGGGLGQREELGRAGKQVSGPGGRLPSFFLFCFSFLFL